MRHDSPEGCNRKSEPRRRYLPLALPRNFLVASRAPRPHSLCGCMMHARLPLLPRLLRATALSPGGQTRFHSAERLMEPVYGGGEGRVVVVAVSGTL